MSASSTDPASTPSQFSDQNVTIGPDRIKIGDEDYLFRDIKSVSIERFDDSMPMFISFGLFVGSIYFYMKNPKKTVDFDFILHFLHKILHVAPEFDESLALPVFNLLFIAAVGLAIWAQNQSEWLVLELVTRRAKVMQQPRHKRGYLEKLKIQIDKAREGLASGPASTGA